MDDMDLETLTDIFSCVAALASVGSLVAVAWQLRGLTRQTREAARQTAESARQTEAAAEATRAAVYLSLTDRMINIDQFLVDRPAVRSALYGRLAQDPEADRAAHQAEAAAELMIDMMEAVIVHHQHMSPGSAGGWHEYFSHLMGRSPAVRDFWLEHRHWYGEDIRPVIDGYLPAPSAGPAGQVLGQRQVLADH